MKPDTEPSLFCRHLDITATPRGAFDEVAVGRTGLVTAASSLFAPKPNKEIVAPDGAFAIFFSACDDLTAAARLAAASSRLRCASRVLCLAASAAAWRFASASSRLR